MHRTPSPVDPDRRRRSRRVPVAATVAALLAAVAGVASAGTFAGAATQSGSTSASGGTVRHVIVQRGLRGKTGPRGRTGLQGPEGAPGAVGAPGPAATDVARSLTLNWKTTSAGKDTASTDVPGLGHLDVTCNGAEQDLRLTPARTDVRTVATVERFYSATAGHERYVSTGDPITVPLPVNGMLTAVLSAEPISGDGGPGPAPSTLTLSSELKLNADASMPNDFNFCYVAAQVLRGAG